MKKKILYTLTATCISIVALSFQGAGPKYASPETKVIIEKMIRAHGGLATWKSKPSISYRHSYVDRVLVRSFPATYAEYVTVPAGIVYHLPDSLDFEQAAGIAGVYSTAWQNLVNRAQLQPTETVLVHACASGVGIGNVQVAKHIGATVIGTASTDEKLEWAMPFGVDHGINYVTSDFVEETMRLTGGRSSGGSMPK